MNKANEILRILQDYEIIKNDANLLLGESLAAMCAIEEIEELFSNNRESRKCGLNVLAFKQKNK